MLTKFLVRLGFSLAILVFAFRHVDFHEVAEKFDRLDLLSVILALACYTVTMVLAAVRWRMITLNAEGNAPELMLFIRSFYRGAFLNQGLPTTLGGDTLRVLDLAPPLGSRREAFGTVLLDRVVGFSGLLILNVLMFPFSLKLLPMPLALAVAGISAAGLAAIAAIIALPWNRLSHRHKILDQIAALNTFGRRVFFRPRNFFPLVILSVSLHVFAFLAMFVLARRFGVNAEFWMHLVIQPSVLIASLLPLSLAGWGMREGAMVALFASIGVAGPAVMATSLTYGVIALLASIPGLYFLIRQSGGNKAPSEEQTENS